eukprot:GEMP01006798.1.p1 GENE.GEMP01006798.1~~GEMP01006798.1.p1  ORF type:complete len:492 (+),score=89.07 GEMP01006798.1:62-1537(+)
MRKPMLLLGALRQLLSSKDTAGIVPEDLLCKNAVKVVKILVLRGNERYFEHLRGDVKLWSSRWPEVARIVDEARRKLKGNSVKSRESLNPLEKAKRGLEHRQWRQRFDNDSTADGVTRPVDYSNRHRDDITHPIDYSTNEPPIERHSAGRLNPRIEYDNSHNEGRTGQRVVAYDNSHNTSRHKQRLDRGNTTSDMQSSHAQHAASASASADQQWSNAGSQTGLTIKIIPPANQGVPNQNTVQGPMIPGIRGALFSPIVAPPGGRLSPHRTGHGVASPSMFQRLGVTQTISDFTPRHSPTHAYLARTGGMTPTTRTMTTPRAAMYSSAAVPQHRVITMQQHQPAMNTVFSPSTPAPQQRVMITRQINSPQTVVRPNMQLAPALSTHPMYAQPQMSPMRMRPVPGTMNMNVQRVAPPQAGQNSIQRIAGGATHVSSQLTLPLQGGTPVHPPTVIRRPNINIGGPMMSPKNSAMRTYPASATHREIYKTQLDTR